MIAALVARNFRAVVVCLLTGPLLAYADPTHLTALDGSDTLLESHIQPPNTLVFTIASEEELSTAQRLLTQAYAHDQHALILILLPDRTLHSKALQKAAKRFFKSDLSRSRIFYFRLPKDTTIPPKTRLFVPGNVLPIYQSSKLLYPEASSDA